MSLPSSHIHNDAQGEASSSKVAMNDATPPRIAVSGEDHPLSKSNTLDVKSSLTHPLVRSPQQDARNDRVRSGETFSEITPLQSRPKPRIAKTSPEYDERIAELQAWLQSARPAIATETEQSNTTLEARRVRRNMLIATWDGFSNLAKARRWILALRTLIGLAQLVVGIVILSLPSSLGDSFSTPQTCNPEGMFVYLTLHTTRIFFSIPVEFYLGLSPHRTSRSRREGAEGQLERERTRAIGNLALDRRCSRLSDLLGLCHVVLFIVGNYIVWTSVECSHAPADSVPLWAACVSMLSISYVIILEVAAMIFLLVFFLPLLIGLLHIFGLSNRLPQRAIHPETGKISQGTIEEQTRLVYYTPAKEEERRSKDSLEELERLGDCIPEVDNRTHEAASIPLPLSRAASMSSIRLDMAPSSDSSSATATHPASIPRRKRLGLLFGLQKKRKVGNDNQNLPLEDKHSEGGVSVKERSKYPLFPLPSHRASCPICLCDFEELGSKPAQQVVSSSIQEGATEMQTIGNGSDSPQGNNEEEVEPLRLLRCGHVMHMTCVDQWLTTVSGRCPVCQKPLVPSTDAAAAS